MKIKLYQEKITKEQPNPGDWLVLKPSNDDWKQLGKLQDLVVAKLRELGVDRKKIVKTSNRFAHITILLNLKGTAKNGSFTSTEVKELMEAVADVAGELLPIKLNLKDLTPTISCGRKGKTLGRCIQMHFSAENIVELHNKIFHRLASEHSAKLNTENSRALLEHHYFKVHLTIGVINTDNKPLDEDPNVLKINDTKVQEAFTKWFEESKKKIFNKPITFTFKKVKLLRVNDPKCPDREKKYITIAECTANRIK